MLVVVPFEKPGLQAIWTTSRVSSAVVVLVFVAVFDLRRRQTSHRHDTPTNLFTHQVWRERLRVRVSPSVWNSLPEDVRAVTDPALFRKQLITLFSVRRLMYVDDVNDYVMHLCPIIVIGAL